jgi:hypothetical protein
MLHIVKLVNTIGHLYQVYLVYLFYFYLVYWFTVPLLSEIPLSGPVRTVFLGPRTPIPDPSYENPKSGQIPATVEGFPPFL